MKKYSWIFYLISSLIVMVEIGWLYHEEDVDGLQKESKLLQSRDMQEDIAYFFSQLRMIHPNLYVKYDSITFVTLEEKMKEACSSPQSPLEFECIQSLLSKNL